MKYCTKCGKELFDEAVFCPGCGCPTPTSADLKIKLKPLSPATPKPPRKKMSKKTKVWCIVVLCLVLLISALITFFFMPRNLQLDDFCTVPTKVNCLFTFGIPSGIDECGDWCYIDRIAINGVIMEDVTINFEEENYTIFNLSDDKQFAISTYIDINCMYDLAASKYHKIYYYGDLEIRCYGTDVMILFKD